MNAPLLAFPCLRVAEGAPAVMPDWTGAWAEAIAQWQRGQAEWLAAWQQAAMQCWQEGFDTWVAHWGGGVPLEG